MKSPFTLSGARSAESKGAQGCPHRPTSTPASALRVNGRAFVPLLCVILLRCTCDLPSSLDAGGFACATDSDCAEGWFCGAGRCLPDGSPIPDGGTGGGSAGGGAGGGGTGGGQQAEAALHLRFTTPPRTVMAGTCSPEVGFALFDDAGTPVSAPADISVTVTSTLEKYGDPSCMTPVSLVRLRSDAGVWFSTGAPGSYDLTISSTNAGTVTQVQQVVPPGMPRLAFTTAAPPVQLAGGCIGPITVESRDGADQPLAAPSGGRRVDLSVMPGGMRFSTQSNCGGQPPTFVTIAAGATTASFYVSSDSGRDYTLTASSSGFMPATQQVVLRPLVRSGSCTLSMNETSKTCAVTPPQLDFGRTFLVYQASSPESDPSRSTVACVLADAGAVTCQREEGVGFANVTWQTAELSDSRVDRYDVRCPTDGGQATLIPLAQMVQPAQVFTLLASSTNGSALSANDFFVATPSASQLVAQWSNGCAVRRGQAQVVHVPGFTVARATGTLSGGLSAGGSGLPALGADAFTTAQWRHSNEQNGDNRVCDRMLRSVLSGNTAVAVSRGNGNNASQCTGLDIDAWAVERVDTGARASVQELSVWLDAGVLSATRTISAVDLTRALVFASGQSGGAGQGGGEGASAVDGGAVLGEASATLQLVSATQLQVSRAASRSSASFTVHVVELNP